MKQSGEQRTIGYVTGENGCITPNGKPFYQVRLDAAALDDLLSILDRVGQTGERRWHLLAGTATEPSRLRCYRIPTPKFEQRAATCYLRGRIFRISGKESINVGFSVEGASIIAERLRAIRQRMRRFVLFRVPDRKKDVLEFLPDVELEGIESREHARLAETGAKLAAQVLEPEDFSDWEQSS